MKGEIKKSCDNCNDNNCKISPEWKRCYDELEDWKKKKECQINALERSSVGCELECIKGDDCSYFK
jgi:hypothetical protein